MLSRTFYVKFVSNNAKSALVGDVCSTKCVFSFVSANANVYRSKDLGCFPGVRVLHGFL